MKIVIAIDSFKNSMTSLEAGEAVAAGIARAYSGELPEICIKPLADGGEGTAEAFLGLEGGERQKIRVEGPVGEPVCCTYVIVPSENLAIIEMAGAAGLGLVEKKNRDPGKASTLGVGQVILDAIDRGIRNFIIGLGGSATNDCGLGMLQAMGYVFLDKEGNPVGRGGKYLAQVESIENSRVRPELKDCTFRVAGDVNNPLCGPRGASFIYGPQKGADPDTVRELDLGCRHFAQKVKEFRGKDESDTPGAGAAGGLGFAFMSFLHAIFRPGAEMILEETGLEKELQGADFLVTGEGKLDEQTAMGKAPARAAALAKKYGVKTIALAGGVEQSARICNEKGIDAFFSIVNGAISLEQAMEKEQAKENMSFSAEQIFRLIRTCSE